MLTGEERIVSVGVVTGQDVRFTLHGRYEHCPDGTFRPIDPDSTFTLHDVTIGIDFHWQRQEDQTFSGALRIIDNGNGTHTAVNMLPVEDYLVSVISSEMSPTAPEEFLKAHAVISRSWLLRAMQRREQTRQPQLSSPRQQQSADEPLRWYDNDGHQQFDVCADDHCQRYQGIARRANERAEQAVRATRGEVLTYNGEICDARFSKCCGGRTEEFQYCWADEPKPYLSSVSDAPADGARPFCDTHDTALLSRVMNDYDCETDDFYRWTVRYTRSQLSDIVRRKTGSDLGDITDIVPLERGKSQRLWKLRIVGTKGERVVGKELEIRRVLSENHLYSSAFIVERDEGGFTLHGRGWGHGVGLCQIGAAVMADRGYNYHDILRHYYRGAATHKLY